MRTLLALVATTCVGMLCWIAGISIVFMACQGPDRWHTSIARGHGDTSSPKVDFDTEETTLELGVSGPIGRTPTPTRSMPVWAPPPSVEPVPVQGTDWEEIAGAVGLAVSIALAAVKYLPSKSFEGPFDRKKT